MRTATKPEVCWTVTVTGRSARGLLRDCTSYRTEVDRTDAERGGLEEATRRWPASTTPIKVSSYASVHTVRADQDWKEICQWQERDLSPHARAPLEPSKAVKCRHCDHLVIPGKKCWYCQRICEAKERDMQSVSEQTSTTGVVMEEVPPAEELTGDGSKDADEPDAPDYGDDFDPALCPEKPQDEELPLGETEAASGDEEEADFETTEPDPDTNEQPLETAAPCGGEEEGSGDEE